MHQLVVTAFLAMEVARSNMSKQLGIAFPAVLGVKERFVGLLVREGQMKVVCDSPRQ